MYTAPVEGIWVVSLSVSGASCRALAHYNVGACPDTYSDLCQSFSVTVRLMLSGWDEIALGTDQQNLSSKIWKRFISTYDKLLLLLNYSRLVTEVKLKVINSNLYTSCPCSISCESLWRIMYYICNDTCIMCAWHVNHHRTPWCCADVRNARLSRDSVWRSLMSPITALLAAVLSKIW